VVSTDKRLVIQGVRSDKQGAETDKEQAQPRDSTTANWVRKVLGVALPNM